MEHTADKTCGGCGYFTLPWPGGPQKATFCMHPSNKRAGTLGCDKAFRWESDGVACYHRGVEPSDEPCERWTQRTPEKTEAQEQYIAKMLESFGPKPEELPEPLQPPADDEPCPLCGRKKAGRKKRRKKKTKKPRVVPTVPLPPGTPFLDQIE